MNVKPLVELAVVIRSKNSGPFELTLDIIYRRAKDYEEAKRLNYFTKELFAKAYSTTPDKVLKVVYFDPVSAVKATLVRPVPSGVPGDSDVYGAQQHAPLLKLVAPVGD